MKLYKIEASNLETFFGTIEERIKRGVKRWQRLTKKFYVWKSGTKV